MNKNETKDGFVSHLVELRERLIHSFIFLFVFFIVCYFYAEYFLIIQLFSYASSAYLLCYQIYPKSS